MRIKKKKKKMGTILIVCHQDHLKFNQVKAANIKLNQNRLKANALQLPFGFKLSRHKYDRYLDSYCIISKCLLVTGGIFLSNKNPNHIITPGWPYKFDYRGINWRLMVNYTGTSTNNLHLMTQFTPLTQKRRKWKKINRYIKSWIML